MSERQRASSHSSCIDGGACCSTCIGVVPLYVATAMQPLRDKQCWLLLLVMNGALFSSVVIAVWLVCKIVCFLAVAAMRE